MIVQRDVLLRQIAQLAAAVAKAAAGKRNEIVEHEDDVEASVGLSLDVAEHLPNIPDGRQAMVIGLALARRAQHRFADGRYDDAARAALAAERFITDALRRHPELASADVDAARAALGTLWED